MTTATLLDGITTNSYNFLRSSHCDLGQYSNMHKKEVSNEKINAVLNDGLLAIRFPKNVNLYKTRVYIHFIYRL